MLAEKDSNIITVTKIYIMFIQAFSRIFRYFIHIQLHSQARNQGGERRSSPPLFENRKKCPEFGKKSPDCIHHWVEFSIQDVVLRVFRIKNSKTFPCGASFPCVFEEMFFKVQYSQCQHIQLYSALLRHIHAY